MGKDVTNKKRIVWFDILKGFTILMVVYSHLMKGNSSVLNSFYSSIYMQIFFVISGFFIYSMTYDFQLMWKGLKARLKRLMYPTVVLFVMFVLMFRNGDFSALFNTYKAGYWFTYVWMMFFVTLAPMLVIFSKFRLGNRSRIAVFLVIIVLSTIVQTLTYRMGFFSTKIGGLLSFEHYIGHLKFLVAGCIFRILWDEYDEKLMCWWAFALSLAGYAVCEIIGGPVSILSAFFAVYALLFAAYTLSRTFTKSKILNCLSQLGSLTLEIYLLHFFILEATVYKISGYQGFIARFTDTPWEFPILIALSLAVALICILIVKMLKLMKIQNLIFWK